MPDTHKKNARDVLRIVFRRWRLLVLGAAVFAIVVLNGAHAVPLKYTGTAVFEMGLEAGSKDITNVSQESFDTVRQRLREDLSGLTPIEEALEALKLTEGLPRGPDGRLTTVGDRRKQEMIEKISKGVAIRWASESRQQDVVYVSYTDADPKLAEQMPNALISGYVERIYSRLKRELMETHNFIQVRVESYDGSLSEVRRQIIDFETRYAGYLPDNPAALHEQITAVTNDIEALRRRKTVAESNLARIKGWIESPPEPTTQVAEVRAPNPRIRELEDQVRQQKDLLDRLFSAVGKPTEDHPQVIAIRRHIAELEKELAEAPATVMTTSLSMPMGNELRAQQMALQAELDMCDAELDRLQSLLKDCQDRWANAGPIRQQYLQLLQTQNDLRHERDEWRSKLTAVEAALNAQMTEKGTRLAAVRSSPTQYRPSSPTLMMVFGFAIVGGLGFGAALVFAASLLDRSVTTTEEAACFNVPICGVIGEITTAGELAARRIRRWTVVPIISFVLLVVMAISGLSIGLKLYDPMKYDQEWKPSPVKFIFSRIVGLGGSGGS